MNLPCNYASQVHAVSHQLLERLMGEWRLMEELVLLRAIYLIGSGTHTQSSFWQGGCKMHFLMDQVVGEFVMWSISRFCCLWRRGSARLPFSLLGCCIFHRGWHFLNGPKLLLSGVWIGDLLQQFASVLFNKLDRGESWDDYYELNTMLQVRWMIRLHIMSSVFSNPWQ